jgi:hypothetical protein
MSQNDYQRAINRLAVSLRRRDEKRGGTYTHREAADAIHQAIVDCQGRDHWTGERLDWSLWRTYDNEKSKADGAAYWRSLSMQPSVDHRNCLPVCDFVICSRRTNDAKSDMTIEELKDFARRILEHNG